MSPHNTPEKDEHGGGPGRSGVGPKEGACWVCDDTILPHEPDVFIVHLSEPVQRQFHSWPCALVAYKICERERGAWGIIHRYPDPRKYYAKGML